MESCCSFKLFLKWQGNLLLGDRRVDIWGSLVACEPQSGEMNIRDIVP